MAAKFKEDIFVGARFSNKLGQTVKIIGIEDYTHIKIEWEDEFKYVGSATTSQLRTGAFKNPYSPLVHGVGYLGSGLFKPSFDGERTREYAAWLAMLGRCYSESYLEKYPTYKKHEVEKVWHNFQNFAAWYSEKSKIVPDSEVWHLDKDILGGLNYGPDNCVLIPARLNLLLVKNDARRGDTLIGVSYDSSRKKYRARCHNGTRKVQHLGWRDTEEDAFKLYKVYKENLVRSLAEEYKDLVDSRAYQALRMFEVNETQ